MTTNLDEIIIKQLAIRSYTDVWQDMRDFTDQRGITTLDEIWLVEHPPVFTQGQNGKPEHILAPGNIPVVQTDRGGQVTYHGPGQLVAYLLINLRRRKLGIRDFVRKIEQAVIDTLAEYAIEAYARLDAPGVYTDQAKICSLGLRVRRGCSYHGLAFNIDMDLEPFSRINPCGMQQLQMTQVSHFVPKLQISDIEPKLIAHLCQQLGYTTHTFQPSNHTQPVRQENYCE